MRRGPGDDRHRSRRFNPHPAEWPGDAWTLWTLQILHLGFNPHPAEWPGDAAAKITTGTFVAVSIRTRPNGRVMHFVPRMLDASRVVSIRTRPNGRVMPAVVAAMGQIRVCFNPHPAEWPGDAAVGIEPEDAIVVSIRTRPNGRVMHPEICQIIISDLFQSAPGRMAG